MPTSGATPQDGQYSAWVGLIYIFNLIVGTGALAIPAAFNQAGWLLGIVVVIMLAFISYLTSTFVIESMASANAIIQWQKIKSVKVKAFPDCSPCSSQQLAVANSTSQSIASDSSDCEDVNDQDALLDSGFVFVIAFITFKIYYNLIYSCGTDEVSVGIAMTPVDFYSIQRRVEMGEMASMFFNKFGIALFYFIICIYLYGDLAIYGAAIAKSLRDVTCNYVPPGGCVSNLTSTDPCWTSSTLTRSDAYRIYVAVTVLCLGPFGFFNVQKTTLLQIITSLFRWIAFTTMIVLASAHLIMGRGDGSPPAVNFEGLPNFFGVCVYSFMCHHSLPSLVTPIRDKSKVYSLFAADYSLVLVFYLLLALTGIFSFANVQDLYTLNFRPERCESPSGIGNDIPGDVPVIQYFLALFPVFTLSANFPVITITLSNNLKSLMTSSRSGLVERLPGVNRVLFPLLAILPPTAVALATQNVQLLVGITGAFAGAGVQYVVPACLVICSRKVAQEMFGIGVKNRHKSPFKHQFWTVFTLLWTLLCLGIIIFNYAVHGFKF